MTLKEGEAVLAAYQEKFGELPSLTFFGMTDEVYLAVAAKCSEAIERGRKLSQKEASALEPKLPEDLVI